MNLLSIIRSIPLAFLVFPFAFAIQVLAQNEYLGLIPYGLLIISAVGIFLKSAYSKKIRWGVQGVRNLDFFCNFFLVFTSIHIAMGILLGGYTLVEAGRLLLIYVGSGWIYFYISRYAREAEIRTVMLVIAIAAIIIGLDWVYETYTKMILHEISEFQRLAYEYSKIRNNFSDEEMNTSALGTQYRAHGLLGGYPYTGSIVAIGAFAMLALFPYATRYQKNLLLGAFFLVLSIGLATTVWIAYVLICPFLLGLSEKKTGEIRRILARIIVYISFGLPILIVVLMSMEAIRPILQNTFDLLSLQFASIINFDATSGELSWFWLYFDNLRSYSDFLMDNPFAVLVGEGIIGYGDVTYARGGDVALLEFAAAYGIPTVILFFATCISASMRAVRSLKNGMLNETQKTYLLFSFATLVFLILSLSHYNILFNKAIIVFFYLALGLIRRYGYNNQLSPIGYERQYFERVKSA